ncbi:hypothetical protein EIP86_002135 [Pleurotus ostreatoroseus]|nr:hypothetical protein EIP86_002135 [Pleurotus ostreatoroseus]
MDIEFIASGEAAKAVIFYIRDWITKSELKAHVAHAAMELAVKKLSVVSVDDDDLSLRCKILLQKCAFALLNHQEMPAPQVAMFLEGHELCYRSHEYANLYWTSFETHLEKQLPSPECALSRPSSDVTISDSQDSDSESEIDDDDDADSCYSDGDNVLSDDDNVLSDELLLDADGCGGVQVKADQLTDYVHRGDLLNELSVWEFVRCTMKVPCSCDRTGSISSKQLQLVLADVGKRCPCIDLHTMHPESDRKHLKIVHPALRPFVVPIGPALPRRDNPDGYARYYRIMLMLFKPWRCVRDLRSVDQFWPDAFHAFETSCSVDVKKILYNIQFLYECQDSQEDHFRNRAHLRKMRMSDVADSVGDSIGNCYGDGADDSELLSHLDGVQEKESMGKARSDANVLTCLAAAERHNLYGWTNENASARGPDFSHVRVDSTDCIFEKRWTEMYADRRAAWKRKKCEAVSSGDPPNASSDDVPSASFSSLCFLYAVVSHTEDEIETCIARWTLNHEQSLAFRIIANRARSPVHASTALRMFIAGPGGTALSLAKGCDLPFGGINVVFAGDFAQLPPVGKCRLFGSFDTQASSGGTELKRQYAILGKLLWLSVDTVVMLHEQMRQAGSSNVRFVELLQRLRHGRCTEADYEILSTRVLGASEHARCDTLWADAPVIAFDNATKDALNVRAVSALARATGQTLQWYYANDRHNRRNLTDAKLRDSLRSLHSGRTNCLIGKLPVVTGMKVIITKNFDVPGGVVNGSIGTLKEARYFVNGFDERCMRSCVVEIPDSCCDTVPGLPSQCVPVMEDTASYQLKHRYSKRNLTSPARKLLYNQHTPSQPIVLKGKRTKRARSLDGVLILRPFDKEKICTQPTPGLDVELDRLRCISLQTKMKYDDAHHAEAARKAYHEWMDEDEHAPYQHDIPENDADRVTQLEHLQKNIQTKFSAQLGRATRKRRADVQSSTSPETKRHKATRVTRKST